MSDLVTREIVHEQLKPTEVRLTVRIGAMLVAALGAVAAIVRIVPTLQQSAKFPTLGKIGRCRRVPPLTFPATRYNVR